MPLASVTPLQKTLLVLSRIETFAPSTGFASSRRVTRMSVLLRAVLDADAEVRRLDERGDGLGS